MNKKLIFKIGKYCCYISFFVCLAMIFVTEKFIFGIGTLMFALILLFCYNDANYTLDETEKDN